MPSSNPCRMRSPRDVALPLGLVDNKVTAIDDTWSGLRLVVRKEHRDSWPARLDSTEK